MIALVYDQQLKCPKNCWKERKLSTQSFNTIMKLAEQQIVLNIYLKFKKYQLIKGVKTKPTTSLLVIHARSDPPYGRKTAVIKARFLWFMRCCNGTQELKSITNNFISKLRKFVHNVSRLQRQPGKYTAYQKKTKMAICSEPVQKGSKIS